jgi:hypothetical protein
MRMSRALLPRVVPHSAWWLCLIALATLPVTVDATVTIKLGSGPLSYTEGDPAVSVDAEISVTGTTNIESVTVQIRHPVGTPQPQMDVLSTSTSSGLSALWTPGSFTLTVSALSAGASAANFQSVLRNVRFANTASDLSGNNRSLDYKVLPTYPVV